MGDTKETCGPNWQCYAARIGLRSALTHYELLTLRIINITTPTAIWSAFVQLFEIAINHCVISFHVQLSSYEEIRKNSATDSKHAAMP